MQQYDASRRKDWCNDKCENGKDKNIHTLKLACHFFHAKQSKGRQPIGNITVDKDQAAYYRKAKSN